MSKKKIYYVVKNIHSKTDRVGIVRPYLTENGVVLLWPGLESIPEVWQDGAVEATPEQLETGSYFFDVVETEAEKGKNDSGNL
jgi:hypothetical protein